MKVFIGLIILFGIMTLMSLLMPVLFREAPEVVDDLLIDIIAEIENGNTNTDRIRNMFLPECTVDDKKLNQLYSHYKGTMISFERTASSYRSSVGQRDYSCTYLVTTTESAYQIKINWIEESSEKSGLYFLSIATEDTLTLP